MILGQHADWERIKTVINDFGMAKGYKNGEYLFNFINDSQEEYEKIQSDLGTKIAFLTERINVVARVHPEIPLKELLDENGIYQPLAEDPEILLQITESDSELVKRLSVIIKNTSH